VIALAIADITNPYYFGIIRGAQAAAIDAGYTMLLANAQESDRLEREALDRSIGMVDGIVLTSTRMSDSAIRKMARLRPLIVLNRVVVGLPCVVTDHRHGMREAVAHLTGLGHTSMTYVAGPEAAWADSVRWQALREIAAERGLKVHRIGPHPPTVAGGVTAVEQFRTQPAGAVIAYNDMVALGFLQGLAALGAKVPADVSVIGFDNIFGTELVTPGLTTVASPLQTLGATAVRQLVATIGGAPPQTGDPVMLPTRLVIRCSTGPFRRRRTAAAFRSGSTAGG
jgi:LacI family transcriptional regulator